MSINNKISLSKHLITGTILGTHYLFSREGGRVCLKKQIIMMEKFDRKQCYSKRRQYHKPAIDITHVLFFSRIFSQINTLTKRI